MAITRIRQQAFTLPTGGATATFTIADMEGLVPVAARFAACLATAFDVEEDDESYSLGYCTASADYCVVAHSEHGDSAFNAGRAMINDRCVFLPKGDGSASECELSFSSFSANTVVCTVDKAASTADLYVIVTLIACEAAEILQFATAPGFLGMTNIPFTNTPHITEALTAASSPQAAASASFVAEQQIGYAITEYAASGVPLQGGYYRFTAGFSGTAFNATNLYIGRMFRQVKTVSGSSVLGTGVGILGFNATTMTWITVEAPWLSFDVCALCLHFGDTPTVDYGVGVAATPVSTGSHVVTTGARPQFMAWCATYMNALSPASGSTTSSFGLGGVDFDGRGSMLLGRNVDGANPTSKAKAGLDSSPLAVRDHNGVMNVSADWLAMDGGASPGVRLDFTKTIKRQFTYWWVEDEPYSTSTDDIRRTTRVGLASPLREIGAARKLAQPALAKALAEVGLVKPLRRIGASKKGVV